MQVLRDLDHHPNLVRLVDCLACWNRIPHVSNDPPYAALPGCARRRSRRNSVWLRRGWAWPKWSLQTSRRAQTVSSCGGAQVSLGSRGIGTEEWQRRQIGPRMLKMLSCFQCFVSRSLLFAPCLRNLEDWSMLAKLDPTLTKCGNTCRTWPDPSLSQVRPIVCQFQSFGERDRQRHPCGPCRFRLCFNFGSRLRLKRCICGGPRLSPSHG